MCETGAKVFDQIYIPFVIMEWHDWRINHQKRYQFIVDFFTERKYAPVDQNCRELNTSTWLIQWPGNIFWLKRTHINGTMC